MIENFRMLCIVNLRAVQTSGARDADQCVEDLRKKEITTLRQVDFQGMQGSNLQRKFSVDVYIV